MSPRFSFLRYISKANEDDIIPSCASIDEICAAEAPCGIFIKIIDSSISSLFETILAVWSIDEAMFEEKLIAINTATIVTVSYTHLTLPTMIRV